MARRVRNALPSSTIPSPEATLLPGVLFGFCEHCISRQAPAIRTLSAAKHQYQWQERLRLHEHKK